nr:MAG TPA: hypothetical protein [Caudoviricetes sp.]DAR41263.1 MAG TPA: hypothetical protein [Caudoviricetes sp.]
MQNEQKCYLFVNFLTSIFFLLYIPLYEASKTSTRTAFTPSA